MPQYRASISIVDLITANHPSVILSQIWFTIKKTYKRNLINEKVLSGSNQYMGKNS